jgi:hypothetical protein
MTCNQRVQTSVGALCYHNITQHHDDLTVWIYCGRSVYNSLQDLHRSRREDVLQYLSWPASSLQPRWRKSNWTESQHVRGITKKTPPSHASPLLGKIFLLSGILISYFQAWKPCHLKTRSAIRLSYFSNNVR